MKTFYLYIFSLQEGKINLIIGFEKGPVKLGRIIKVLLKRTESAGDLSEAYGNCELVRRKIECP